MWLDEYPNGVVCLAIVCVWPFDLPRRFQQRF